VDVTLLQVCIIVVKVSIPVVSVLWDGDFQPGFEFPTVVDDIGALKLVSSNAKIMAKPENMPSAVERQCLVVEDELAQWQASCLK